MSGPRTFGGRLVRRVRLEFMAGRSDKFYLAEVYENPDGTARLALRWGRRGTFGQEKIEECNTVGYAVWALERKLDEKRAHGYLVIEDGKDFGAGLATVPPTPPPKPQLPRRPAARAASDPRNDWRDVTTADDVFPMDQERKVRLR